MNNVKKGGVSSPPGIVCIPCGTLGRYIEFHHCVTQVLLPKGSDCFWKSGHSIPQNINKSIQDLLDSDTYEWIWILDDDHVFEPDILFNLLQHDVPVVTPLVTKRVAPFGLALGKPFGDKLLNFDLSEFNGKSGLFDASAFFTGAAGMLIRKEVFAKIDAPWMENKSTTNTDFDYVFCRKLAEAKIPLHIDLDTHMGHIAHMAVWPQCVAGQYSVTINTAKKDA